MKAIIQRVTAANVTGKKIRCIQCMNNVNTTSVASELVSSIGPGLCVLVGIAKGDTIKDVEYIARTLLSIRLFDGLQASPTTDDAGDKHSTAAASPPAPPPRWKRSVKDCDYSLLCVSQFTLCCQLKGNKPDYHLAMPPQEAQMLYEQLLGRLRSGYRTERVFSGQFGAYMQLSIVNDGPVTIEVDSLRGAVASQEVCVPLAAPETLN